MLTSTSNVVVFITLMVLWQLHHSFPDIGTIFVTGIVTVPTDTVYGSVVFQPPSKQLMNVVHLLI